MNFNDCTNKGWLPDWILAQGVLKIWWKWEWIAMTIFEYCNVLTLSLFATIFCFVFFSHLEFVYLLFMSVCLSLFSPHSAIHLCSYLPASTGPYTLPSSLSSHIISPAFSPMIRPSKSIILILSCQVWNAAHKIAVQFTPKISIFIWFDMSLHRCTLSVFLCPLFFSLFHLCPILQCSC